jgi:bacteriorhodopsin
MIWVIRDEVTDLRSNVNNYSNQKFKIRPMAELHVQRKRSHYLWFWVLLVIALIAAAVIFYVNYDQKKNQVTTTKASSVMVVDSFHHLDFIKI